MKRLWNLIRGFFGLFVSGLENANPQAMLESEINNFNTARAQYNTNLAQQAALAIRLKEQVSKETKELDGLKAKTTAMLAAKQNERAGELALACKEKMASLTENQEQLKNAEELYKNLTRQRDTFFKEAQKRLDTIKNKISRAQMAEAQAKMAEIASAMTFDMNGSGANLERLEKGLDDRIADAQGKSRVAADSLKSGGFVQLEAEQKALEAQALAEFATSMGITPPATETPLAEETPESKKELA